MKQYLDMLEHVMQNGEKREDRTGTGTLSVFGYQARFDLKKGFPLLTTKKTSLRLIWGELKWFLEGNTNLLALLKNDIHIWDGDSFRFVNKKFPGMFESEEDYIKFLEERDEDKLGDLGPIYGKQWRAWEKEIENETIDQIANVIESIKEDPYGRRHIITAWNPADVDDMALPPCHIFAQFYVTTNGELKCQMYQRSADLFLGVPFNIASYSLLTHYIAHQTGLVASEFVHTFGDMHLYLNHLDQAKLQLNRTPKELPTLRIKEGVVVDDISEFNFDDLELTGYKPDSKIKGKLSVGK